MGDGQIKINKNPHKSVAVQVHGLCRWGFYYEASLVVGPLAFSSPNGLTVGREKGRG